MAPKPGTFRSNGTSGQAATEIPTRSSGNVRRLDAAHKHLDRMFAEAEDEQIDGRKFWGIIRLELPFQDGEAQDILASKDARDRLQGGKIVQKT